MKIVIDIPDEARNELFDIANNGEYISLGLQNIVIMAIANGIPYEERPQMKTPIYIEDIYRLVAGHSIYSGDSILTAFTCLSEGRDVKDITPLDVSYSEIADLRQEDSENG